ncbi:MAG: heme-binding protein [Bauldia sp.]
MDIQQSLRLTHAGALKALAAAVAKAEEMGVPQNITIVDASGVLLAFVRMDGSKFLSIETSRAKAMTAASSRAATSGLDPVLAQSLAVGSGGKFINLKGGVPIIIDGQCVGGIGVGSGTGEQDLTVARAALDALGAEQP